MCACSEIFVGARYLSVVIWFLIRFLTSDFDSEVCGDLGDLVGELDGVLAAVDRLGVLDGDGRVRARRRHHELDSGSKGFLMI